MPQFFDNTKEIDAVYSAEIDYVKQMPRRWYNPVYETARDHIQQALDKGWLVVNAPRTLGGQATWTGAFLTGIHYATGPTELFIAHWYRYGATIVDLVDDALVEQMARTEFERMMDAWLEGKRRPKNCESWEGFVAYRGLASAIKTINPRLPFIGSREYD
jgi:hypothetical protein